MRSADCVVVNESQIGVDGLRDGSRRVISILFSGGPHARVVQRLGPRMLSVGNGLLLPGKLGFFQNNVDAVLRGPKRLPSGTATASELPIPGDVFAFDSS